MRLPKSNRRTGVWKILIAAAILIGAAGLLWLYDSDPSAGSSRLPQCLFKRFTGLYCPGCGATRSIHAMLHWQPLAAFRYNFVLYPAMALAALLACKPELSPRRPVCYSVLAVIVLFWIGRNLPWLPFRLLAPCVP